MSERVTTIEWFGGSRQLTWEENGRLRYALQVLQKGGNFAAPLLLFRGESKANLRRQLMSERWRDLPDEFLYLRLFFFGEKARHFSMDSDEAVARRSWLTSITDVSSDTFSWLFDQLCRIVNYRPKRVLSFCEESTVFAEYFGDAGFKNDFLRRTMELSPRRRAHVRDYYLYLLHTYGKHGIYRPSVLISTSESLAQARKFAGVASDGVILYLFLPTPWQRFAISSRAGGDRIPCVRGTKLPMYYPESGLYKRQREISLRGAAFPQFIVGLHDRGAGTFVVNPHLLEMSQDLDQISRDGIHIDQDGFDLHIRETGYLRHLSVDTRGRNHGFSNGFFSRTVI